VVGLPFVSWFLSGLTGFFQAPTLGSFLVRRAQFTQFLSSNKSLTAGRYARLMGLACTEMLLTTPSALNQMVIDLKARLLEPWRSCVDSFYPVAQQSSHGCRCGNHQVLCFPSVLSYFSHILDSLKNTAATTGGPSTLLPAELNGRVYHLCSPQPWIPSPPRVRPQGLINFRILRRLRPSFRLAGSPRPPVSAFPRRSSVPSLSSTYVSPYAFIMPPCSPLRPDEHTSHISGLHRSCSSHMLCMIEAGEVSCIDTSPPDKAKILCQHRLMFVR
jgi:hypothetical protein